MKKELCLLKEKVEKLSEQVNQHESQLEIKRIQKESSKKSIFLIDSGLREVVSQKEKTQNNRIMKLENKIDDLNNRLDMFIEMIGSTQKRIMLASNEHDRILDSLNSKVEKLLLFFEGTKEELPTEEEFPKKLEKLFFDGPKEELGCGNGIMQYAKFCSAQSSPRKKLFFEGTKEELPTEEEKLFFEGTNITCLAIDEKLIFTKEEKPNEEEINQSLNRFGEMRKQRKFSPQGIFFPQGQYITTPGGIFIPRNLINPPVSVRNHNNDL